MERPNRCGAHGILHGRRNHHPGRFGPGVGETSDGSSRGNSGTGEGSIVRKVFASGKRIWKAVARSLLAELNRLNHGRLEAESLVSLPHRERVRAVKDAL